VIVVGGDDSDPWMPQADMERYKAMMNRVSSTNSYFSARWWCLKMKPLKVLCSDCVANVSD